MISLTTLLILLGVLCFLRPILWGVCFVVAGCLGYVALAGIWDGAAWFIRNAHPEDWIALALLLVCLIGGPVVWEMRRGGSLHVPRR